MNTGYAAEDERNRAVVAAIAKINVSIEDDPDDLYQARKALEDANARQISPSVSPVEEDERSTLERVEGELQAEQAVTSNEGLRRILASVEGESYKVDMTPDRVYVVTYNAKVAVGAFLDLNFAGQVVRLLNKTGQNPDGTDA